jgi:hypothetical protein
MTSVVPAPRLSFGERLQPAFGLYDDGYANGYSLALGTNLGRKGRSRIALSLNAFKGQLIDVSIAALEGNVGGFSGADRLQNVFRWKANYFLKFRENSLRAFDPNDGNDGRMANRFMVHVADNLVRVHRVGKKTYLAYGAGFDLKLSYLVPVVTLPLGMGIQRDVTNQDTIGFYPTMSFEGAFNLVEFDPDEDIYYHWGYLSGAALGRIAYKTRRLAPLYMEALSVSSTSGYLFEQSNAYTNDTKFYLHTAQIAFQTRPFLRGPLELRGDYYLKTPINGSIDYSRQEVGIKALKRVRLGAFDILVGPSYSRYDARLEGVSVEEDRYMLNMNALIRPVRHGIPETPVEFKVGHSNSAITSNHMNESADVRRYVQAAEDAMNALEGFRNHLRYNIFRENRKTGKLQLHSAVRRSLRRYLVQLSVLHVGLQNGSRRISGNEDAQLVGLLLGSACSGLKQEMALVNNALNDVPEALSELRKRARGFCSIVPDFDRPIDRKLLGDLTLKRLLRNLARNPEQAIANVEARLIVNSLNMIRDHLELGPFKLDKGDVHFIFVPKNIPLPGFKEKGVSFLKSALGESIAQNVKGLSNEALCEVLSQISQTIETMPVSEEDRAALQASVGEMSEDATVDTVSRAMGELSYEALLEVLGTPAATETVRSLRDSLNKALLVFEKEFYELSKHTLVGDDPRKLPGQYLMDDFEAAMDARKWNRLH